MATLATGTQGEERVHTARAWSMSALAMVCAVNSERRKLWRGETEAALEEAGGDGSAKRVTKRCFVEGCGRLQRSRGLCKAHGGGRRCSVEGCKNSDQGGGSCIRHGGGVRCSVEGCKNAAQRRLVCKSHGGGDICKAKVNVPKVKAPKEKTPKEKKLKVTKLTESDASTLPTAGDYSYVEKLLAETREEDYQRCVADEAAAVGDAILNVVPSLQTVRDDRPAANSSPHTVACMPKAESVSPTGKPCVIAKWPQCKSVTPTKAEPAGDDNINSCVSVAALLLSLQTQARK